MPQSEKVLRTMSNIIKLLFYVRHFSLSGSGAENDALFLCLSLAKRGYDVHVIAETYDNFKEITIHQGFENRAAIISTVMPDITIDLCFEFEADIHRLGGGLHQTFLHDSLSAYSFPFRLIKQFGYCMPRHINKLKKQKTLLQGKESAFLTISNAIAQQAVQTGAAQSSVTTLYNCVDTIRFQRETILQYRDEMRSKWGLESTDIVCLFIAHNLKLKNLRLLEKVFSRIYSRNPSLKLVLVGKRKPAHLPNYLRYQETTNAIEKVYAAADILLHPSYFDSFANVVLEAMSCSIPVIVSDRSGISELIESGENGIVLPVVPVENAVNNWTAAIEGLSKNHQRRSEIGSNARITAMLHQPAAYLDYYEELIHNIISGKHSANQDSKHER